MIKTILKFLFAGSIIYWLVRQDKIDFSLVTHSFQNPTPWIIALSILLINEVLTSFRWKMILQVKSEKKIPLLQAIKLTWIGMFFSSVLPGAVTGDLVKMVYARSLDSKLSRSFLLTSVMFDRIIGLMGLIILVGGSSLIFYNEMISASPEAAKIIKLNFILLASVLALIASIFLPQKFNNLLLIPIKKIPFIGHKIEELLLQVWLLGGSKKTMFKCLGLSIVTQMINCIALWCLALPYIETPIPTYFAFSFIPLGLISIAIPITPAGLGVGHAIFGTLFAYFGTNSGASIFNLFFIAIQTINLLGVFPFLTINRKKLTNLQKQTTL